MKCPPISELVEVLPDRLAKAFLAVLGSRLVSLALFGSYARGDFGENSDVDVLVVLESVEDRYTLQRELDKVEELLEPFFRCFREHGYYPQLSPVVLSMEQAGRSRPLYLDIVFDCKILYDREGFLKGVLEEIREKLREYGAKRVRVGKRWVTVLKEDYKFGEVIEF